MTKSSSDGPESQFAKLQNLADLVCLGITDPLRTRAITTYLEILDFLKDRFGAVVENDRITFSQSKVTLTEAENNEKFKLVAALELLCEIAIWQSPSHYKEQVSQQERLRNLYRNKPLPPQVQLRLVPPVHPSDETPESLSIKLTQIVDSLKGRKRPKPGTKETNPPSNIASDKSTDQQDRKEKKGVTIKGDWSLPMSKAEMMTRLQMGRRAFDTFTKIHGLRNISPQKWSLCLDKLDKNTRHAIERGRTRNS